MRNFVRQCMGAGMMLGSLCSTGMAQGRGDDVVVRDTGAAFLLSNKYLTAPEGGLTSGVSYDVLRLEPAGK